MTENEAIERIRSGICNEIGTQRFCRDSCMYGIDKCAYSMAIQALTEIQQYRAIGTVERFRFLQEVCGLTGDELEHIANSMIELKNYRAIGTIDEFKALKEKSVAKKVKGISLTHEGRVGNCPACGRLVRHQEQTAYCSCEQKLYWSEE